MSLITTCPNCQTSFRVVADQLKLHRGLVRCGKCQNVFSGLDRLRRIPDKPPKPAAGPSPAPPVSVFRTPRQRQRRDHDTAAPVTPVEPSVDSLPGSPADPSFDPPLDAADDLPPLLTSSPDSEDLRFAQELEAVAREIEASADDEQAIDYFSADRKRLGFIGRLSGLKLSIAAFLIGLLAIQAVLANRHWLAARYPALEPAIVALASPFGLSVELPRTLDALAIESFELQTTGAPGLFSVAAIVRNDAVHPVRWPSMLLTLTDPASRVLLRKAIDPADFLAPADVAAGLRARSERPIRLALEAPGVEPAGYSVTLFYR
ncbi:MAG: DUF3426 domain-containing protein [Burkholderiaceae bacterium]